MKRILMLCAAAVLVCGCSSINRVDATRDAIDKGLVEGLTASNHVDATVWSFPRKPFGSYTKLGGLTASVSNSPAGNQTYVFYLGKSRQTGKWEVFASMVWKNGHWEPVPVKLPQETNQ